MTDNNMELNNSSCENENKEKSEHRSHHHHSHHHSHHKQSHHSSSHHSSSHHSSSRHGSSSYNSSSRGKKKDKAFSLAKFLEKTSLNTSHTNIPQYRKISQRILFCLIFFGFIALAIIGILSPPKDSAAVNAGKTRSEADQLRSEIIMLQYEIADLNRELDEYKRLYGELEPDDQEITTQVP